MRGRLDPRLPPGLAILAAGAALIFSWQYGYVASVRAARTDREAAAELNGRLAEVDAMLLSSGGRAAWTAQRDAELAARRARIPEQQQLPQLLNQLVDALKAGELQLLDVAQGNLQPVLDTPAGTAFQRLPVAVTAEGAFTAVVAALERLGSEAFPYLLRVDAVDLKRRPGDAPLLQATLTLSVFVAGAPPAPGAVP
jgi:hypothetical protein